jgi:hypothetical protein
VKTCLAIFKVDEYGSREPIEFLRLLYEQGGMFGREKEMHWNQLKDIGKWYCVTNNHTLK